MEMHIRRQVAIGIGIDRATARQQGNKKPKNFDASPVTHFGLSHGMFSDARVYRVRGCSC